MMKKESSSFSVVRFGRYMQKDSNAQEKQPIEWIIIRKEKEKTWLLSRYCLDCSHYHFKDVDIDWVHCDLRAWLREAFLPRAFAPDEQRYLAPIPIIPECSLVQKNANAHQDEAFDWVSIMEKNEAMTVFPTYQARQCTTTNYAEAILQKRGTHHPTRVCSWWVRDNHLKGWKAPAIGRMGWINMYSVTDAITMVRPLIYVGSELINDFPIYCTIESV